MLFNSGSIAILCSSAAVQGQADTPGLAVRPVDKKLLYSIFTAVLEQFHRKLQPEVRQIS